MKRCTKCGAKFDGKRSTCKPCDNAACREYRKRASDEARRKRKAQRIRWRKRHKPRYAAQAAVKHALKTGKLHRKPCEKCGAQKAQAHHENYRRKLDVVWLCPVCHRRRHIEINWQKNYLKCMRALRKADKLWTKAMLDAVRAVSLLRQAREAQ